MSDHAKNESMDKVRQHGLFLPIGTQVVTRADIVATQGTPHRPKGSVGVVTKMPADHLHAYRVRFPDGHEASLKRQELSIRKHQHEEGLSATAQVLEEYDLYQHVIYCCLVGSRAYGLATENSDEDRRGIYLPPAQMHWSLFGIPEQLENTETDECYWELQKFLTLALKGNPNILECLYSPIVESITELGQELLGLRQSFLSKLIYQTYNGYAIGQFKKMEQDLRNQGKIKLKHAMHLIRLLLSGICALRDKYIPVDVGEHRQQLLEIKNGIMPWEEVNRWRLILHDQFEQAFKKTDLPERPDYEAANDFLVKARTAMVERP